MDDSSVIPPSETDNVASGVEKLCFPILLVKELNRLQISEAEPSGSNLSNENATKPELTALFKQVYKALHVQEKACNEMVELATDAMPSAEKLQSKVDSHVNLQKCHCEFFDLTRRLEFWNLASDYAMPTRFWHYSVGQLFEELRLKLPGSSAFTQLLLSETFRSLKYLFDHAAEFREDWLGMTGDLARCIVELDFTAQVTLPAASSKSHTILVGKIALFNSKPSTFWKDIAKDCYMQLTKQQPMLGRPRCLLGPFVISITEQLYCYSKALMMSKPYPTAHHYIKQLCTSLDARNNHTLSAEQHVVHAIAEASTTQDAGNNRADFVESLRHFVHQSGTDWEARGSQIAISLIAGVQGLGHENAASRMFPQDSTDHQPPQHQAETAYLRYWHLFDLALTVNAEMMNVAGTMPDTMPFMSLSLAFLAALFSKSASDRTDRFALHVSWPAVVNFLNRVISESVISVDYAQFNESCARAIAFRPLPEDAYMAGTVWAQHESPDQPSTSSAMHIHVGVSRLFRCFNYGLRLAKSVHQITFDEAGRSFKLAAEQGEPARH